MEETQEQQERAPDSIDVLSLQNCVFFVALVRLFLRCFIVSFLFRFLPFFFLFCVI